MADTDKPTGNGLWKRIDVLTKRNRDKWFRALPRIAKGERCGFLLTHTELEYCAIKDSKRGSTAVKDDWKAIYVPADKKVPENLWYELPGLRAAYVEAE